MNSILHELWLHSVCNFEPECVDSVISVFESAENAFGAKAMNSERIKEMGMPKRFVKEFSDSAHIKKAEKILEYCNKKGIRIITMKADEYPECLKHMYLPPRILFAAGKKLDFENKIAVSVVGCRKSSDKGRHIAEQIGYNLAQNGIAVISGMAEGIDAAAHEGALKAGGETIAVLAGGVDVIYPLSNRNLYYRILENGTIISERPPGVKGKKYFYQQRNRIIVGMSAGVVITEGEIKGGTSITARHATDNNKDVFAVPGNPTEWRSALPNSLLADGAIVVEKVSTPADYYKDRYPKAVKANEANTHSQNKRKALTGLTEEDKKIIGILRDNNGILNTEMIAEKSGISVGKLSGRLTMLSIKGILKQESGNRFLLVFDEDSQ